MRVEVPASAGTTERGSGGAGGHPSAPTGEGSGTRDAMAVRALSRTAKWPLPSVGAALCCKGAQRQPWAWLLGRRLAQSVQDHRDYRRQCMSRRWRMRKAEQAYWNIVAGIVALIAIVAAVEWLFDQWWTVPLLVMLVIAGFAAFLYSLFRR